MGDPEKYSRRRREQLEDERPLAEDTDRDPFGWPMAAQAVRSSVMGCVPNSLAGLVALSVLVIGVAIIIDTC